MERNVEKLLASKSLTESQILLKKENGMLENNENQNIPPLQIRYHHFWNWRDFSCRWLFYKDNGERNNYPWEIDNFETFRKRAENFSTKEAGSSLAVFVDDYKSSETRGHYYEDPDYYQDLIGDKPEERNGFLISRYLLGYNFLLRSNRNKNQLVTLNYDTDGICRGCRGGITGTGSHCLKSEKPGDDSVKKSLVTLRKGVRDFSYEKKEFLHITSEGIKIPIKLFYDFDFGNDLDVINGTF